MHQSAGCIEIIESVWQLTQQFVCPVSIQVLPA